jgi:hypothetical protein
MPSRMASESGKIARVHMAVAVVNFVVERKRDSKVRGSQTAILPADQRRGRLGRGQLRHLPEVGPTSGSSSESIETFADETRERGQ